MGYRHSREEIVDAAVEVAMADGLSRLSFGRVARRLGVSDRMVVYYLPSKQELVGVVLAEMGGRLRAALAPAVREVADDHRQLLRRVWATLATVDADPVFALFFEAAGLAAAGQEPFRTAVSQLTAAWVAWTAEHLRGTDAQRQAEAVVAIGVLDGLLLLRQVLGPEQAAMAAARLEIA